VIRRRVFFIASAMAAAWVLLPLLPGILVGAALAFLSEPLNLKLTRQFKVRRGSTAAFSLSIATVLLLSLVILLPFSAVVIGALEQISLSLKSLSQENLLIFLGTLFEKFKRLTELLPLDVNPEHLTSLIGNGAQTALSWLGQNTGRWLAELPGTVFTAALAVLSWGYFLIRGRELRIMTLRFLFPWSSERQLLRNTFSELLRSLVLANIFVSVVQALIIGIFMAFAGIPHLLLWCSAAFFLSFIPVIGTAPITLGSALWCWTVADSTGKAMAMLVCAFIAGTSDNFLRPLMARRASGELNSFWLFLAMMGGLAQFGAAGFILGPFAFALALSSAAALRHALKNPRI
jgi:predicted PurR-regulated permease PerM